MRGCDVPRCEDKESAYVLPPSECWGKPPAVEAANLGLSALRLCVKAFRCEPCYSHEVSMEVGLAPVV